MDNITYPHITEYIESLVGETGLGHLEKYAEENSVPIIQKDALSLLLFMVGMKRPKRLLELGTAIGYSAIAMALESPHTMITTVDLNTGMKERAEENIRHAGLSDRIEVVLSDCMDFLKGDHDKFDMVFIDARKSHYMEYLELSLPLLNEDGLIIVDNVLFRGLVPDGEEFPRKYRATVSTLREFTRTVSEREDLSSAIIPIGDGVAFIRRKPNV